MGQNVHNAHSTIPDTPASHAGRPSLARHRTLRRHPPSSFTVLFLPVSSPWPSCPTTVPVMSVLQAAKPRLPLELSPAASLGVAEAGWITCGHELDTLVFFNTVFGNTFYIGRRNAVKEKYIADQSVPFVQVQAKGFSLGL